MTNLFLRHNVCAHKIITKVKANNVDYSVGFRNTVHYELGILGDNNTLNTGKQSQEGKHSACIQKVKMRKLV